MTDRETGPKRDRLSEAQLRALKKIRDGVPVNSHCRSMSDYGGLTTTMFSLLRRGFVNDDYDELTDKGRKALEETTTHD